jgi:signal transduction histidine kinase
VQVDLLVDDDLFLRVVDDGVGISADAPRGKGLANMESRAKVLGGSLRIMPGASAGTVLEWRVPLRTPL